jgi:hypothetical protein
MGVYKLSAAGGIATPRTNYSSFLAGNDAFINTAYASIGTVTLSSAASSITFSSIPQTYKHLQLRGLHFLTSWAQLQWNGVTASNYVEHELRSDGSAVTAATAVGDVGVRFMLSGGNASYPSVAVTDILDYTNTNKNKTIRSLCAADSNSTGGKAQLISGFYPATTAITSLTITDYFGGNLPSGTSFALYGIKG